MNPRMRLCHDGCLPHHRRNFLNSILRADRAASTPTDTSRNAPPADAAALFDAALVAPRLLYLDSEAPLEAALPMCCTTTNQSDAAVRRRRRPHPMDSPHARPFARAEAAHRISRVVNQGLQWQAQKASAIDLQRRAIDTITGVSSP
ncbi:hypothetical protein J2W30_006342 [Variovorax boronicumulans]|uniref:hypothetical protein n=1 Tax=Variovorax boronicumulans TaxID=436515 RepID=UPI00277E2774|nr:hypothetical protein [Variovorax boronicumulans]MDQ0038555.1 hypothetical protein [Variovorax boronicumulans]